MAGNRGETLIEFALALMLFLGTILGTMIFGLVVFRYNMLSNLAQEGARRASVCGVHSGLSSTDCDVAAFVQARALGINVTSAGGSVIVTPTTYRTTLDAGETVTVQVTHRFNPLTGIIPVGTLTFSSTATMIASY